MGLPAPLRGPSRTHPEEGDALRRQRRAGGMARAECHGGLGEESEACGPPCVAAPAPAHGARRRRVRARGFTGPLARGFGGRGERGTLARGHRAARDATAPAAGTTASTTRPRRPSARTSPTSGSSTSRASCRGNRPAFGGPGRAPSALPDPHRRAQPDSEGRWWGRHGCGVGPGPGRGSGRGLPLGHSLPGCALALHWQTMNEPTPRPRCW